MATAPLPSAATRVGAARAAGVTRPGALHHAAALLAGWAEVETRHLGWDHRWGFGEGRRCRGRLTAACLCLLGAVAVAGLGAAVAAVTLVARPGGVAGGDAQSELARLRLAFGPHLPGEDAEVLELVDIVDEAARQPTHDVVGHRFGEGDLRVLGHPLRLEAHVAELAHEDVERDAVLEAERDRRGEGVEQPAHGRSLLADVGEEDLADGAVLVLAGGDVALVAGDPELVGDRLALARHPLALGGCGGRRFCLPVRLRVGAQSLRGLGAGAVDRQRLEAALPAARVGVGY